jgi:hypothetical protein
VNTVQYSHRMNQLAASLDAARLMYALMATGDPRKAELAGTIAELTTRLRMAERAVMASCLDLAECIPQDRGNYAVVRELVTTLRALVLVEEKQS